MDLCHETINSEDRYKKRFQSIVLFYTNLRSENKPQITKKNNVFLGPFYIESERTLCDTRFL